MSKPILQNAKLKRSRGRPIKGLGSAPVQITLERGLLKDVDDYAQSKGISRSELIALLLSKEVRGPKRIV